jgi:hypothetical protein
MKKLIEFIKKLLGLSKPKPTPQPTMVPNPTPRPTFNYFAKGCETGVIITISITKQIPEGSVMMITNRENTGCHEILGPTDKEGLNISAGARIFPSCEECYK